MFFIRYDADWLSVTLFNGDEATAATAGKEVLEKRLRMMNFAFKMMNFALKIENYASKMMNFVLKMMHFAFKMVNCVLKMMDFGGARKENRPADPPKRL